ncbi:hypothetical protein [Candidatus Neptunochlamydia vexilliferae]|uniref:Uncharacterized protein n=1 Tax=Candidatus Neptunichlamydia vexilliferae TaxID=1651774 RepID=A0ABS0AYE2_9BACT|nr:hypothetical protein [Candidatus Neptunochlamydia vexilliferae]MBF5059149.1 hypothetical protein [Candidatus Neptunochlamydia vexilliferae]
MSITFIKAPPFRVDFEQYRKESIEPILSLEDQISRVTGIILRAAGYSAFETLKHLPTSFKHIALGYRGSITVWYPPKSLHFAVFKMFFWVLRIGLSFLEMTYQEVMQALGPSHHLYLQKYAGEDIDPRHLRTTHLEIDVSHVPADVTISRLLTEFDKLNFDRSKEPGHRKCPDGFTVERLRAGLKRFVDNVNGRVPFLATPPASQTAHLLAFYDHMERATRCAFHAVLKALEEKADENTLEDHSRFLIDFAMSGEYCGTRFMSQAMRAYGHYCGGSVPSGTLEDSIVETLAQARNDIASKQIAKHFGGDVHGHGKYMDHLGELLGIPGTAHVIETLSQDFDTDHYLKLFFEAYTPNFIIKTIQKKVKKSAVLREQVFDWLKDQRGNWVAKKPDSAKELEEKIQAVLEKEPSVDGSNLWKGVSRFLNLLTHLKNKGVKFPKRTDWQTFVFRLFILKESKNWIKDRGLIMRACNHPHLAPLLNQDNIDKEALRPIIANLVKVEEIRKIAYIGTSDLLQVIDNQADLSKVVKKFLESCLNVTESHVEFLQALDVGEAAKNGFSTEIIEWLLVHYKIFRPQEVPKKTEQAADTTSTQKIDLKKVELSELNLPMNDAVHVAIGVDAFFKDSKLKQELKASIKVLPFILDPLAAVLLPCIELGRSRRYSFETSSARRLRKVLFNRAFKINSQIADQQLCKERPELLSSYPEGKSRLINHLNIAASIIDGCPWPLVWIAAIFFAEKALKELYRRVSPLAKRIEGHYTTYLKPHIDKVRDYSISLYQTRVPPQVKKEVNRVVKLASWIHRYSLPFFVISSILQEVGRYRNLQLVNRFFHWFNPEIFLIGFQSLSNFSGVQGNLFYKYIYYTVRPTLSRALREKAHQIEVEKLQAWRSNVYQLWNKELARFPILRQKKANHAASSSSSSSNK